MMTSDYPDMTTQNMTSTKMIAPPILLHLVLTVPNVTNAPSAQSGDSILAMPHIFFPAAPANARQRLLCLMPMINAHNTAIIIVLKKNAHQMPIKQTVPAALGPAITAAGKARLNAAPVAQILLPLNRLTVLIFILLVLMTTGRITFRPDGNVTQDTIKWIQLASKTALPIIVRDIR